LKEKIYTVDYILENEIDKKAYGFIYITENMLNNIKYIGKRKFSNGWKGYFGSGIHFKRAIKLYGKENFKRIIIDIAQSQEELSLKEKYWIKLFNAVEDINYYNISVGGDGAQSGKDNPMFGKRFKHSDETKQKISKANKGHIVSIETKKLISLNHINVSEENNPMYGKHRTEELKNKLSQIMKLKCGEKAYWFNKNLSNETKQKISKANSKKIVQLDRQNIFIREWDSIIEASKSLNISDTAISRVCKKEKSYHTAGNFKWIYYEDYIIKQDNKAR
jgi:group I intron endonuclease